MSFYDVKEDWAEAKKRWEAWWNFDMIDRPVLMVHAPKSNPQAPAEYRSFTEETSDFQRKYCDPDYISKQMLCGYYHTYYGGEAVPVLHHGWSVGHAVPFGCHPNFAAGTIWTDTVPIKDGEERPEICFDENNKWWKMLLANTEKMARGSEQRDFVMPMWGNHAGDNLLMIRGSENLLFDCIEDPDWVAKSVKAVSDAMLKQFAALQKLTPLTGLEGGVDYCSCWAPGVTYGVDCDFSCMISPEMYRKMFLPPLIETMQSFDYSIYHLDGVVALQHLDTLLDLKEINAIQWVPGEGNGNTAQWVPLVQKILSKKKGVLCYTSADEVIPFLKDVGQGVGICIHTWAASEDAAKRLCEDVAKLYK